GVQTCALPNLLGDLRKMAAVDPDRLVDALHLELEDLRVGVELAPHAVRLHHLAEVRNGFTQHGFLLRKRRRPGWSSCARGSSTASPPRPPAGPPPRRG